MYSENELTHYGIEGQKWGVRRYQYEDGSLTPEGRIRYGGREEFERRISRAEEGAKAERKISKLEGKRQTEKVQRKLEGLRKARDLNFDDLTEEEIDVGRRYYDMHRKERVAMVAGGIISGIPGVVVTGVGSVLWETQSATGVNNRAAKERAYRNYQARN